MKNQKQRIIALDYFRGICILMVVINHSWIFSMPFTYLAGAGGLCTSAAELFFLISGITLMIVRGKAIQNDFKHTAYKIWRRAGFIYALNLVVVSLSISLAFLLPASITRITMGTPPSTDGFSLLGQILSFQYSIGLASFLMYYSVFLVFAPMLLYLFKTRLWPAVLGISVLLFGFSASHTLQLGAYTWFAVWQLYFVLGIAAARIRIPVSSWFNSLSATVISRLTAFMAAAMSLAIAFSLLLAFNLYPTVDKLTNSGWLPAKIRGGYYHLLKHETTFNTLFGAGRMGILRPLTSILFLTGGYLLYQKYKSGILRRSERFVTALGRDTLWIFVAQAFAIPLLAALPLPRNLAMNFTLTSFLVLLMWTVTKRRLAISRVQTYFADLQASYNAAKFSYLYQSDNDT